MKILGIDHINMVVPDVDAAVRFYCGGLGLELLRMDATNAIAVTPDGVIVELSPDGSDQGDASGITHVCYNTWDVDQAFARALELGAVPSRESDPEPTTWRNLRMAFVRTPFGEEIEFWSIMKPDGTFGEKIPEGMAGQRIGHGTFDKGEGTGTLRSLPDEPVYGKQYIKQFVHVALTVEDLEESLSFYEALGASRKENWGWGASMTLPDGRELEFFTGGQKNEDPQGYRHMSLLVDDVDGALAKTIELGGAEAHEPYDWSNLRICFVTGLTGETVEYFYMYEDGREPDVFKYAPEKLPDLFRECPELKE